jgi:hypothetical protein
MIYNNVSALQAADLVCWAVRRRSARYSFTGGFEPLETILDAHGHNQSPIPEAFMRDLLERLENLKRGEQEEP